MEKLKDLARRQEQEAERQRRRAALGQQASGNGSGQSQRELADQAEEAARRLEQLSREENRPDLMQSARQLRDAADAMRRAAANGQQASARAGGRRARASAGSAAATAADAVGPRRSRRQERLAAGRGLAREQHGHAACCWISSMVDPETCFDYSGRGGRRRFKCVGLLEDEYCNAASTHPLAVEPELSMEQFATLPQIVSPSGRRRLECNRRRAGQVWFGAACRCKGAVAFADIPFDQLRLDRSGALGKSPQLSLRSGH